MILVTTPTGQIGREVVARLLDAPEGPAPVRVIVRDPAALAPEVRERVEAVQGSHADPAVLKEACQGADRVFWLVPPNPAAASVDGHFRAFTEPLCEVIGAQGPQRVVAVSTLGRGIAANAGLISAGLAMDEAITATGVHYRALCPPSLMENELRQLASIRDAGVFVTPLVPDRVLRLCATRDIGAAAARLLLDDSWRGQEDVPLVSPDDLTPEGMAGVLSEVLGRPVRVEFTTTAQLAERWNRLGATESWVRAFSDMVDAQNTQGLYGAAQPSTPDTAPTTFRRWCEEVFRPAALQG
ncbi:NAD(P)H-binding protein [Streptomyces sp. DSM 15324]|uniref:NAD(P)H-binding protein n=1 Tax=Streptomyces sp. DSM 15324 TaxID=1739111 RepID=UPI0007477A96|nr:NAD(P)H-binding protein [Streptomyces sp. DSM 15324]KUO08933.1 NmrA family transcriptional regulator [Streptomyces sp. DSM 15324]